MDSGQASEALDTVRQAAGHAARLRHYRGQGPVLVAWGIVWLIAFTTTQFAPDASAPVWLVGWIAALGYTFTRPRTPNDARMTATWLIAAGFVASIVALHGSDQREAAMIFALALGAAQLAIGVWIGARFALLGGATIAVAAAGWWLAPDWLFLTLGLGGGSALIAFGLWLQRP